MLFESIAYFQMCSNTESQKSVHSTPSMYSLRGELVVLGSSIGSQARESRNFVSTLQHQDAEACATYFEYSSRIHDIPQFWYFCTDAKGVFIQKKIDPSIEVFQVLITQLFVIQLRYASSRD